MLNRSGTYALVLVLILLFTACNLPVATCALTPHDMIGVIYDLDNNTVMGATVYANNTGTNESLNIVTDEFGRYSINTDADTDDIFIITVIYYQFSANGSMVITPAPFDQLDLYLDFHVHIIDGYILKPDGLPANHFAVKVTNMDRNEYRYVPSALDGYYRIDIGAYPGGFAVNEDICVSVDFSGFNGSQIGIVSENLSDMINITLIDNDDPAPHIQEAPASVNINQHFRILVWVTENHIVDSVTLFVKKSGEPLFTEIDMIRDDGAANDWNGDHMATAPLFGQSTSIDLDVQTDLGDLLFYALAEDFSGNTGTVPTANPQINPLRIEVIDTTKPALIHTPITVIEAGETENIVATAIDNLNKVDEVTMYVKEVGQSVFTAHQMHFNGNPHQYNATMPPQNILGTLEYYVWCNDTNNNTARLPVSGSWPVNVVDTIAPQITHAPINSVRVNDTINFTCQISDATALDSVWLNFTDVWGNDSFNETMIDGGSGNWYYLNQSGQNWTGILHYTIWANDTSGNLASISHSTAVNDEETPLIFHAAPIYLDYNISTTISAYVVDNLNIDTVFLHYEPVGITGFTEVQMASTDFDVNHGNFSADIPPQDIGTVKYFINATDLEGNEIIWPAVGPPHEIDVLDVESPEISNLAYTMFWPANTAAPVQVNVTDNCLVGDVVLYYLNDTASAWTAVSMNSTSGITYQCQIPPQEPGTVKLYVSANDSSGNNALLPADNPRLYPKILLIYDNSSPELEVYCPWSTGVNSTTEIIVNATDDQEVISAVLYYNGTEDGSFTPLTLSRLENGTYRGIVPPQNHSGSIQIYATVSDGMNPIQSQIFSVSVINQPPEIQHIGVDSAPVGDNIAMIALVTDDLRVENVLFSWRPIGNSQYSDLTMNQTVSGTYRCDLVFDDAIIIQYHITAFDAENSTTWPDGSDHEISIMDLEFPIITHQPLAWLNVSSTPIITATVTDNQQVSSVKVWYKNATASTFFSAAMSPVSNLQDTYTAVLGQQPEGNFTYYIEATDGINSAETEQYTVEVIDNSGTDWTPALMVIVVILLMVIAIILVILYHRRKPIKEEANPPEK